MEQKQANSTRSLFPRETSVFHLSTSNGTRYRVETPEWYIRYKGADGVWQQEKGYTDRASTEALAATIRKRESDLQAGIANPFAEQYARPLYEKIEVDEKTGRINSVQGGHLADWEQALSRTKTCERDVSVKVRQVARVIHECGFEKIPDIKPSPVDVFLQDLVKQGRSSQTHNHYLATVKQFCLWLMERDRLPSNPLKHLKKRNVDVDRRRVRRDLTPDEVTRLLEAAVRSEEAFLGLTGADRFVIYYLALGSGLRASEIGSLTPESFLLDEDPPLVVVEAMASKHRERDEQPLQPDLAAILLDYLADKPSGELLWPTTWNRRAANMLRIDLEAAGIPYVDASGRYADFHAQRHTYITVAGRNLPPQMQQRLARHKDYKTTRGYTHHRVHDTAAAVAQLPPLLPGKSSDREVLQATGTEGGSPADSMQQSAQWSGKSLPSGCHRTVFDGTNMQERATHEGGEELEPMTLQLVAKPGNTDVSGPKRRKRCSQPAGGPTSTRDCSRRG